MLPKRYWICFWRRRSSLLSLRRNSKFVEKLLMPITSIDQLTPDGVYSYADYLTWKFEERVELIKGKLFKMSPAPSRYHQEISSNLLLKVLPFFSDHQCHVFHAPFDVRILDSKKSKKGHEDIYSVVQPDICVICDEEKLDDRGCIGAPDWIIEILSPGNTRKELNEKFRLYEENAVREYWIVHPTDQTLAAFELQDDRYQLRKLYSSEEEVAVGIFPELVMDLQEVFTH